MEEDGQEGDRKMNRKNRRTKEREIIGANEKANVEEKGKQEVEGE